MTKQEEIREGIAGVICDKICGYCAGRGEEIYNGLEERDKGDFRVDADKIIAYLHNNDVVIKVDRELPAMESQERSIIFADFLKKSGYVAVEPLNETTRRSK